MNGANIINNTSIVFCATRILPKVVGHPSCHTSHSPNILSTFVPGLDRNLFKRALLRTANLVQSMNYIQYHPLGGALIETIVDRQQRLLIKIVKLESLEYAKFEALNECISGGGDEG